MRRPGSSSSIRAQWYLGSGWTRIHGIAQFAHVGLALVKTSAHEYVRPTERSNLCRSEMSLRV